MTEPPQIHGSLEVNIKESTPFSEGIENNKIVFRISPWRFIKGQVSIELLAIVGFIMLLFIPLILFMHYKTNEMNVNMASSQSFFISSKLASIANSVGSMGDGSALKVEFILPAQVKTLYFGKLGNGGEVMFVMNDGSQISQITRFPFNSTRNYSGGAGYKLEFLSQNGSILVLLSK